MSYNVGDILDVIEAPERLDGYLATREGDALDVLSHDHDGFVFCVRRSFDGGEPVAQGQVETCTLRRIDGNGDAKRGSVTWGAERVDGYLATRLGERVPRGEGSLLDLWPPFDSSLLKVLQGTYSAFDSGRRMG